MARRPTFERAVIRECTGTAGAAFVALFAILLTTQLIRLLGQAAGGKLVSEAVVALLGFGALMHLPILLSLTLFIAVLMTLSRSYRDSEMSVWFASGLPLTAWVKPVLKFSAPVVAAIAVLSLLLSPWAQSKSTEYRQRMDTRDDVARVSPGAFKESASGERVFFVEAATGESASKEEGAVRNIFISSIQHGRLGVMMSTHGYTESMPNGDRFVVLVNGRRYEGTPGSPEYRVMEFERYAVRIETKEARGIEQTPKSTPTLTLMQGSGNVGKGEILWRIGLPLAALNLALLAIPLSFVNPRAGRTNNLVLGLLTYMFYSNLVSVCQAWVAQGRLRFETGWWLVHAVMFVVLVLFFFKRLSMFSWARLRR
ncbi:MAG: LPS export ABC transporter permease LptF [Betaproteobacteria bacterium]|nr:LPS export ABC transporter permease LptF [Betaproteobacteria bacterium]